MSTFTECPNADCQGLIEATSVYAAPARSYRPTYGQGLIRVQSTFVYCETCRRAFEIIAHFPGVPKFFQYHASDDPVKVAMIVRRIALGNASKPVKRKPQPATPSPSAGRRSQRPAVRHIDMQA